MKDRRRARRFAMVLIAVLTEVRAGKKKLTARTSDISLLGCYVDSLETFPAGTQIQPEWE